MNRWQQVAGQTDAQLAWRYQELRFHLIECAISPEHPTSRMNRARWQRELRQVVAACERRGLFEVS